MYFLIDAGGDDIWREWWLGRWLSHMTRSVADDGCEAADGGSESDSAVEQSPTSSSFKSVMQTSSALLSDIGLSASSKVT